MMDLIGGTLDMFGAIKYHWRSHGLSEQFWSTLEGVDHRGAPWWTLKVLETPLMDL